MDPSSEYVRAEDSTTSKLEKSKAPLFFFLTFFSVVFTELSSSGRTLAQGWIDWGQCKARVESTVAKGHDTIWPLIAADSTHMNSFYQRPLLFLALDPAHHGVNVLAMSDQDLPQEGQWDRKEEEREWERKTKTTTAEKEKKELSDLAMTIIKRTLLNCLVNRLIWRVTRVSPESSFSSQPFFSLRHDKEKKRRPTLWCRHEWPLKLLLVRWWRSSSYDWLSSWDERIHGHLVIMNLTWNN